MKRQLKQFRYYGENVLKNSPNEIISKKSLTSGSVFFNSPDLVSIASLGIQTLPGVKFYLNDSVDSIIVGSTGIYELNFNDNFEITSLKFDSTSLDLIGDPSNSAYLIVDIVYNVGE